jgi:hypothetical protein
VEPLEGERGSGAVAEEALEASPVGGLDADAGIEAEPRRPGGIEGPVHDAQVVVVVGIEARAEAMEKAHGTHGIGLVGQGEVALQVFPDDAMQRGGLGAASRGESRSVSTRRRAKAWGGGMGERVPPQESWAWRRPWRQRIIPTPSWIQPHGEFGLKRAPGGGYDERNY